MIKAISLLMLFCSVFCGPSVCAQEATPLGAHAASNNPPIKKLDGSLLPAAAADSIISQLVQDARVTGLCISVLNDNQPVYTKAFGVRNNRTKKLLDTSTIIYCASFSKSIFAFLVMHLVEENKLSLDTPLYRYLDRPLPACQSYKDLAGDDRWKLITARMCLSHTTGFPNWRQMAVNTDAYDTAGKLAIYFTPGTRYAYSGEGIQLLQLAVEHITGQTVQQLADEKIFRPAGIYRTAYVWNPAFDNDYAVGHDPDGFVVYRNDGNAGKTKYTVPYAAGSMVTTISDYSRLIAYIMQGNGLQASTRAMMLTPQIRIHSTYQFPTITPDTTSENNAIQLSYGLGWGLFTGRYGSAFFKEGHDEGWRNYNVNFPDKKTSIIIMTNSANGESIFKELLEKIIGDTDTPWKWERYTPYNQTQPHP